jgi:hypothetical protein
MSPPAEVLIADASALLSDDGAHEDRSDGATRAEAPPIAMVLRKSLRLAIVISVVFI